MQMNAETIDDDHIEERIENPEPKHLLRLREGDIVLARTESLDFLGYVTEEGELEEWSGGETSSSVPIHASMVGGKKQHATLIYYSDDRGDGLVLGVLGEDDSREELQSLGVIDDE